MGWGGFVVRRAIRSPRSLVYSFTCLLVYEFPRRLVYGSTCLLDYEFPRRLVYGSTCLLVNRFTCLRVPASTRLRVHGLLVYRFTCLRVLASTRLRVYLLLVYRFTRLFVSPVDGVTIVRARQGGSAPAPRPRGPVRSPRGSRPEWCRRPRSYRTGFRVRAHRFRS